MTNTVTLKFNDGSTVSNFIDCVFARWEWIVSAVADRFDCAPDDVGCKDTDDRWDNLTVRGEIVGYVVGPVEAMLEAGTFVAL